jgi:hypothetical protein
MTVSHLGAVDEVLAAGVGGAPLVGGLDAVSLLEQLVPPTSRLALEHQRVAAVQVVGDGDVLCMVGDDDEIERPDQLEALAGLALDLLAAGGAVGDVGVRRGAGHARVGRPGRVQVRVAEIDVLRIVVVHVGGIVARLGRVILLGDGDVLRRGGKRQQHESRGGGQQRGTHRGSLYRLRGRGPRAGHDIA